MYKYVKRVIDFLFALIFLILLSPVMLLVALAIKLDSEGPVFFKQERSVKDGKVFLMYKFRSMTVNNDVHNFKQENEMTRVGKIIRKTSLDELPQLINISCGPLIISENCFET